MWGPPMPQADSPGLRSVLCPREGLLPVPTFVRVAVVLVLRCLGEAPVNLCVAKQHTIQEHELMDAVCIQGGHVFRHTW